MRRRERIVLVHPPLRQVVKAATPEYVDNNRGYMPPMGLLYLHAAIERAGHEPVFLDANLEGWDHEETARNSIANAPDLIGIQVMTFTLPDAYRVAKAVKELDPDVKIVMGGPHATVYPKETAGLDVVDFAFAGEGESGFPMFLDSYRDEAALDSVPGVAYRAGGLVRLTGKAVPELDIDTLPYPARKSSKYRKYTSVLAERNPITTMITSRGCPFKCVFCNRMGKTYRVHSADYVLGEIEEVLSLGIGEIFIHDDTFTLDKERVKAICRGIMERGYPLIWEARTRVDSVDEQLLSLMRRAGCRRLSFGVESGSEKVLKAMRKGIDLRQVENVFKWCRREGITTLADIMFGNIDEEYEDIKKSLDLIGRIRPDYVQYSICNPYPDTELYKLGLERGLIPRDVWLEFARNPSMDFRSPVWPQNFTEDELVKITAAAYKDFYMRPSFILRQLGKVRSFGQFKNMARAGIGLLLK